VVYLEQEGLKGRDILGIILCGDLCNHIFVDACLYPLLEVFGHPDDPSPAAVGLEELGGEIVENAHSEEAHDLLAASSLAGHCREGQAVGGCSLEVAIDNADAINLRHIEADGLEAAAGGMG